MRAAVSAALPAPPAAGASGLRAPPLSRQASPPRAPSPDRAAPAVSAPSARAPRSRAGAGRSPPRAPPKTVPRTRLQRLAQGAGLRHRPPSRLPLRRQPLQLAHVLPVSANLSAGHGGSWAGMEGGHRKAPWSRPRTPALSSSHQCQWHCLHHGTRLTPPSYQALRSAPGSGHQTTRHSTVPSYQAQATRLPGSGQTAPDRAPDDPLPGGWLPKCRRSLRRMTSRLTRRISPPPSPTSAPLLSLSSPPTVMNSLPISLYSHTLCSGTSCHPDP